MSEEVNEHSNKLEEQTYIEFVPVIKRRSFAQKVGCAAIVLLWFLFMLIPFFFIVLAVEEEITIHHRGDIPNKYEHPLLQVKLIMEIDFRGLSITSSNIQREGDLVCIQTHVNYLLWEGDGENTEYCDCYTSSSESGIWQLEGTNAGKCL